MDLVYTLIIISICSLYEFNTYLIYVSDHDLLYYLYLRSCGLIRSLFLQLVKPFLTNDWLVKNTFLDTFLAKYYKLTRKGLSQDVVHCDICQKWFHLNHDFEICKLFMR